MLHVTSRLRLVVTAQYYNLGLRYILRRYSAVEIEAVASLRIDPLTPYLAPDNPFATRRAAEIAERQRQRAPHRSILVRWGIGVITVSGDTATAVTQETWSNQEAGAVAAEQATVRVTYTLRWDTAARRWLIVDTSQMPL
ncbi:MAG: hypothetical protein WCF99_00050 [Chloroflexales bacterium]